LNSHSVKLFNSLFYARHRDRRQFLDYDTYFYPLDSILHWNRIYGSRGFIQYQALFPPESSRRGLVQLLEAVAKSQAASFLAVLKSSGPGNPGMLSYLHEGHTLALDLPNTGDRLRRLIRRLDEILLRHGGRLYLAKDAMASKDSFRAMYGRLDEFRAVKRRVDPENRFASSQARRLGIVEAP
jgi:FAD/FMN-containing dehydrogenase